MAQYSTDFSDSAYADGVAPPDWTETWDDGYLTWTVEDSSGEAAALGSSYGDRVLRGSTIIGGYDHALTWDDAGTPADVDIKVRLLVTSAYQRALGAVARASTDSNGDDGYYLLVDPYDNSLILRKFVNGSATQIAVHDIDTDGALPKWDVADDVWIWARLYISGTTIRGKMWLDGEDEPGSWMIDTTDSAHASGAVGVYASRTSYFDWFGVGTNGDAAPSLPASESDARVTQAVVEILRTSGGAQPIVVVIA